MSRSLSVRAVAALACAIFLAVLASAPIVAAGPDQDVIVVFRDRGVDSGRLAANLGRNHGFSARHVYKSAIKGFSARVSVAALNALRANPDVAIVELNQPVHALVEQAPATWGLDRIDQRALPLSGSYVYNYTGAAVTAYIIDTGIRISHDEFGGRASDGYDAVDGTLPADDCNGHGTHVAGTVGGATYGVAKSVALVAVRVLDCNGSGTWAGVIAGVDWVTGNHAAGAPAVANMSLGGGASAAVDAALNRSIADGVSYAVAAGNSNADACGSSPARVAAAMTIGASTDTDARASFSNFGACVDWFAPGVGITSAWNTDNASTNTISGTSMASPHTAGVAALFLEGNRGASPAAVRDALYGATTKGIVSAANTANNHLLFSLLEPAPPPPPPPPPAETGLLGPTADAAASGGDGNGYQTTPTGAYADDGLYAVDTNSGTNSNTSCTSSRKDKHLFFDYGVILPAGSTITGIDVRLDAKVDSTSGSPRLCVQLSWNGGATWTAAKATTTLATAESSRLLGGATDTWGRTWAVGDLSSANFRVRVISVASSTSRDFSLDWVAVNIHY